MLLCSRAAACCYVPGSLVVARRSYLGILLCLLCLPLPYLPYLPYLLVHFHGFVPSPSAKENYKREAKLREVARGEKLEAAIGGRWLAIGGHRRSAIGDCISESRYAYFTLLTLLTLLTGAFSWFCAKQAR